MSNAVAPPLPPKSKYVRTESLVPILPPKKKIYAMKRVSISSEAQVIRPDAVPMLAVIPPHVKSEDEGSSSRSLDDDDLGSSDDSLATLPSVKELASKFTPKKSPEPVPRKSSLVRS